MCWTEEKTVPTVDRRRFLRPLPTRGIREGADPGFLGPGFRTQSLEPCTRKPRDFEVLNCPTSWLWKEPVRPLGSGKNPSVATYSDSLPATYSDSLPATYSDSSPATYCLGLALLSSASIPASLLAPRLLRLRTCICVPAHLREMRAPQRRPQIND